MSSNNKESLNDVINRLTVENEQLKRVSLDAYAKDMRYLEQSAIALGDSFSAERFEFCAQTAEQFLKNRS